MKKRNSSKNEAKEQARRQHINKRRKARIAKMRVLVERKLRHFVKEIQTLRAMLKAQPAPQEIKDESQA
jgi:hypothetical protein